MHIFNFIFNINSCDLLSSQSFHSLTPHTKRAASSAMLSCTHTQTHTHKDTVAHGLLTFQRGFYLFSLCVFLLFRCSCKFLLFNRRRLWNQATLQINENRKPTN